MSLMDWRGEAAIVTGGASGLGAAAAARLAAPWIRMVSAT